MNETSPACVATDGTLACADLVTSCVPAPLCRRHRMQIAITIVPDMLSEAARTDAMFERDLPAEMQGLIDNATRRDAVVAGHHPPLVYFLGGGDRVKIGFSTNLQRRLESLTARWADVVLLLDGDRRLERALHERYASFRLDNTEWFALAPPLAAFIQDKRRNPVAADERPRRSAAESRGGPVEVSTTQLLDMARRTYQPGNAGVHLSAITKGFRAEGIPARWTLAELGRTYRRAGVKVRDGVRAGGLVSIGIHRDDLPQ
ncbi:GIY-YIG nuclease family protein [Streptomyces vinaceus]|uniref:GIY-YIG nuclease family protein n=1 Tax=Streptomyces vinaceus TaxID=1960 RepID=UPI0036CD8F61